MQIDYKLENQKKSVGFVNALVNLAKYAHGLVPHLLVAFLLVLLGSAINIYAPILIGEVTNKAIIPGNYDELTRIVLTVAALYAVAAVLTFFQISVMGFVGQNMLFRVRNNVFAKLQSLPLAFFNVNKSGDLISRINSDTEKLSQAFSETLLRFVGNIFILIGVGVLMVVINPEIGGFALAVTFTLLFITLLIEPFIRRVNEQTLAAQGNVTAEIQENIQNFKVIVAYNRRDYLNQAFGSVSKVFQQKSVISNIANAILTPIYEYGTAIASVAITIKALQLISTGQLTFGDYITYLIYVRIFFEPLRTMASLFAGLQTSVAAWSRISKLLSLSNNLLVIPSNQESPNSDLAVELKDVYFYYEPGKNILENLNLKLQQGKTYAFVGPTGGGKSTTASLIARLYDATQGEIFIQGKPITSLNTSEIASTIGFILQEPYLFTGTVGGNMAYGNLDFDNYDEDKLLKLIEQNNLQDLLKKFPDGLGTEIKNGGEGLSIGQKQLIAFARVILRKPSILILDEATANVDTVTEELLQKIVDTLPATTTKIVIAHRLNTIKNADQIFFIAGGKIQDAKDFKEAVNLIEQNKRVS